MTADPRPAATEHADRDDLAYLLEVYISDDQSEDAKDVAGRVLRWMKSKGFARTPESAAGTAEPVAWAVVDGSGSVREAHGRKWLCERGIEVPGLRSYEPNEPFTVQPLYLHPAPPPSVGDTP